LSKKKHIINWNWIAFLLTIISITYGLISLKNDTALENLRTSRENYKVKSEELEKKLILAESKDYSFYRDEGIKDREYYQGRLKIIRNKYESNKKHVIDSMIKTSKNNYRIVETDNGNFYKINKDTLGVMLLYANQALDELELQDELILNMEKQISNYKLLSANYEDRVSDLDDENKTILKLRQFNEKNNLKWPIYTLITINALMLIAILLQRKNKK